MRYAFRADGKSAPLWLVRVIVILATPALLLWAFFSVLVRDIGRAFKYAWLEVRIYWAEATRMWGGDLP